MLWTYRQTRVSYGTSSPMDSRCSPSVGVIPRPSSARGASKPTTWPSWKRWRLFASKETIAAGREASRLRGVLEGQEMARVFAWLRPNDLIWNYWVNNYLIGKDPAAFDVLYWNNDTTRLPAKLHSDLLDLYET